MKQVIRRHVAVLLVIFLVSTVWAQQAKYVFYFIGDGMGVNQVNGTEMYLAEQEGRIGVKPLLFTTFPAGTMATTFSATNSVTDSSAAGTALATGEKTYNGAVSMDDDKNVLSTVAERAKKAGRKVGIATSVSVDHATPAAFYAHQPNRSRYYEIALDLPKAGFDFYAGSGFLKPTTTADKKEAPNVFPIIEEAGYTIARGLDEYKEKAADAKKMILIQKEGAEPSCLPYAIDHEGGDLTLPEITESAVSFLSKGNKKGFFLMVEGGKIDWACHSNDPVTVFEEVIDLDNAVRVAYEFYKKHPKETLIVVTADHETGGMGLGIGKYELHLKSLLNQKQSQDLLSKAITDLRKDKAGKASWNEIKDLLTEKMGFWKELPLTWEQEKMLRDEYEQSFVKNKVVFEESLYARTEPLAAAARKVMSQIAMVGWTSSSHTAGYVPVFAIGAGADLFTGKMDNTEIPKRIAKAAGYKENAIGYHSVIKSGSRLHFDLISSGLLFQILFDNLVHFFDQLFSFLGGFHLFVFIAEVCPFGNVFAPFFKFVLCRVAVGVYVLFGNGVVSVNHIIHNNVVFNGYDDSTRFRAKSSGFPSLFAII